MDGIIWKGSPNHYTGRQGYGVTHITLHIMVGYLAGTDSTVANPSSQSSAHYGVGATGEIHQYVAETDGSYSDANYASNCSTISIEHEGGMADGAVCTQACIDASARLCADIARRYGWKKLWHDGLRGNVWLHREIPGTDHAACPDLAPNGLPFQQVIDKANNLLEGKEMALTDEDVTKIWTHKLPNGACVRDCLSPAIQDIFAMHDTGLTNGGCDATSDVIRMHDTLIPQLTAQITALSAAVDAMAKSLGADPDQIAEAVKKAVADKLDSLHITIKAED